MKKIKLSQGKYALVDDSDYYRLNIHRWYFHKKPSDKTGYALRSLGNRKVYRMHWAIAGKGCDHKNRNGIDNRRKNLRKATAIQQCMNRGRPIHKKTLGCKGVSIVRDRYGVPKYWIARATTLGIRKYLGTFKDSAQASRAVKKFIKKEHREFAAW